MINIVNFLRDLPVTYESVTCESGQVEVKDLPEEVAEVIVNFTTDVSTVLRDVAETVKSHASKAVARKYVETSVFSCGTGPDGFEFYRVPGCSQASEGRDVRISLMKVGDATRLDIGVVPAQNASVDDRQALVVPVEALDTYVKDRDAYLRHVHDVLLENICKGIKSDLESLHKRERNIAKKCGELTALYCNLEQLRAQ